MALLPVGCMSLSDTEFFLRCNGCSTHAVHNISRHVLRHAHDIEPYGAHVARSVGSMGSAYGPEGVLCNICAVKYSGADPDWWRQAAWVRMSHEAYQAVDWAVWPRWPAAEVHHDDRTGALETRLNLIQLSLNAIIRRLPATRATMGSVGSVVASNKSARRPQ
jgi:hypothetical protein